MVNIEGIVLHKLLQEKSLEAFADIKACFFTGAYSPIYRMIHKFYLREGEVPSFDELEVVTKDALQLNSVLALKTLEVPDVDLELAVAALIDHYMQNEALEAVDKFVNEITYLDVNEIKEQLGGILLELDQKLNTDETIMTVDKFSAFQAEEETLRDSVATGISNWFDAEMGGMRRQEVLFVGGKKGSGKSLVCANMAAAAYEAGGVVPYYTIEMTGDETHMRIISILAKVDFLSYRKNRLKPEEVLRVAKVRAGMFVDADDLYEKFSRTQLTPEDKKAFEKELVSTKVVKPDNRIIIIDDRQLSITQLDLSMQKLVAEHGDKIKLVLVDYLNQITLGGNADTMYDWKDQVVVSKQLKNLARKYDSVIVSPYQIDETGVARFSKGILDACDMAWILDSKKYPDSLLYECAKARSGSDTFQFRTAMDWPCLRIDPTEVSIVPEGFDEDKEEETEPPKKNGGFTKKEVKEVEKRWDGRATERGPDDL